MKQNDILRDLPARVARAVEHYWTTRAGQKEKQKEAGQSDQELRGAAAGGAQMDGFVERLVVVKNFVSGSDREGVRIRSVV